MGTSLTLKAQYQSVEGLIPGNPVKIKGVKVGRIDNMWLAGDSVMVSFTLDPYRQIPTDSRAEIYSISILGEMGIKITTGRKTSFFENGQLIASDIEPGMIDNITEQITGSEALDNLTKLSGELKDLAEKLNESLGGENGEPSQLTGIVTNLKATSDLTERLMAELTSTASSFSKLADNTNKIMAEVANEKGDFSGSINNLKTLTDSLAAASGTFKSLANGANAAVSSLGEVLDKVNSPNGSLGKLINDNSLYESIDNVTASANGLIESIQTDPGKFRKLLDLDISVLPQRDKRSKEVKKLQNQYDALMLEQAIDSIEQK